ncbi:hypothetical protein V5J35_004411 [Endozoicomonas sp. NE40]|uniref:Tc1-like transposase DDE domain-containing protein n=1 Tax=Endozoicomonas lisbonensis TaxID=3120522 RepID=A0ABV2SN72_9GAMM
MIIDRAGYHVAKELPEYSNLTLIHLPPYSPELNSAEQLWEWLREHDLSNRCFESYESIVDACCDSWNKLVAETGRIASLCFRSWAVIEWLFCAIGINTHRGWIHRKLQSLHPTADGDQIMALAVFFLDVYWDGRGAHLVHIGALAPRLKDSQSELFSEDHSRKDQLLATLDAVNHRFGEFTLCKAPLLNGTDRK